MNDVNPYAYLRTVFDVVPQIMNRDDWEKLLPWKLKPVLLLMTVRRN